MNTAPECRPHTKAADEEKTRLAAVAHATRVTTLGELAASIAHEIDQPLAAIVIGGNACLQWLDRDMPDLAAARSCANQMISDANRAAELVRRLRALSRKADPEYRPLNINDLVTETIPLLRREIASHGAALRLDLHSDVPPVAGDKVQLQQVVINLVVNGIQAMAGTIGRENSLTIQSRRRRGNGVLVSVIDNGTGIDPRHLDTLFDAFFTTKPTGMGMGLSICRSIIEAHGGEVGASNNQGFGATFHFMLPEFSEERESKTAQRFFRRRAEMSRRATRSGGPRAVASAVPVECGRASAATGCAAKPIKKEIRKAKEVHHVSHVTTGDGSRCPAGASRNDQ